MSIKKFLIQNQVFRHEEFANFMLKSNSQTTPNAIKKALYYHCKTGNIVNICKNIYASTINTVDNNYWIDPYLIAAKATKDAIVAYHSALELHGFAYTSFEELTYLSHFYKKNFIFQNLVFKSIRPASSILRKNAYHLFVDEIMRDGVAIKITSIERTIVDLFDKPWLAGGWEELVRSLEVVPLFNPDKLVDYVLLLDNAATIAKIGYFLEQLPNDFKIDNNVFTKIEANIPKSPYYINKNKKSKFFKRWNLLVPLEIVNKTWEEPNEY